MCFFLGAFVVMVISTLVLSWGHHHYSRHYASSSHFQVPLGKGTIFADAPFTGVITVRYCHMTHRRMWWSFLFLPLIDPFATLLVTPRQIDEQNLFQGKLAPAAPTRRRMGGGTLPRLCRSLCGCCHGRRTTTMTMSI